MEQPLHERIDGAARACLAALALLVSCAPADDSSAGDSADAIPDRAEVGETEAAHDDGEANDARDDDASGEDGPTDAPDAADAGDADVSSLLPLAETGWPTGAYADIDAALDGTVWIFAENVTRTGVEVYRNLELVESIAEGWPYALYVRGCAWSGGGAVVFQGGDYPTAHWSGTTFAWTEDGTIFGVEPTGIAWDGTHFVVAYVVAGWLVRRWVMPDGTTARKETSPTPSTQGINRVLPDGTVTLVDDTRFDDRYPLLHRPWAADDHLVVGENRVDPARGLGYHDGLAFVLFDGISFRPRAVAVPGGWIAIAVGTAGIRVVGLPPFADL